MHEIAKLRRQHRMDNGSVSLQNREFMFDLDDDKLPYDYVESERMESKHLVEEYMLLANCLVAEFIYEFCKEKTLLRAHPDVKEDKKKVLTEFYDKHGLNIDLTNSKTLSKTMEALRNDPLKF